VPGLDAQVRQAVANLEALLAGQGATLVDVAKTTVFLVHMSDYSAMNQAYVESFGAHRPARSAVAVTELPLGALVEIEAWAHLAGTRSEPGEPGEPGRAEPGRAGRAGRAGPI
jgi:2-iminobutanoate/2-iminopropanoate deaminase